MKVESVWFSSGANGYICKQDGVMVNGPSQWSMTLYVAMPDRDKAWILARKRELTGMRSAGCELFEIKSVEKHGLKTVFLLFIGTGLQEVACLGLGGKPRPAIELANKLVREVEQRLNAL